MTDQSRSMDIVPVGLGVASGVAISALLIATGMIRERSGGVVLVAAIAAFYPVFSFEDGPGDDRVLHLGVFATFLALSLVAWWTSHAAIGWLMIAHGVTDAVFASTEAPGPEWWPAYCGALDVAAGAIWILWSRRMDAA